jgi:OmpA-OmpF porin, OOP family
MFDVQVAARRTVRKLGWWLVAGSMLACMTMLAALPSPVVAQTLSKEPVAKEKVLRSSEVTADGLVDALDIGGGPQASAGQTRGFRPAQGSGAAAAGGTKPGGGQAGSGKAPLMITFLTGSAELTAESTGVMAKVAEALQSDRLAGFSFRVEGHADPRGGDELNQRLSLARAESVMRHLVAQHGILQERLSAVGKGSSELYDKARIDAPENRRVTIVTLRP